MKNLLSLRPGEIGVVLSLSGGINFRKKLLEIGITPGTEITMVSNSGRGALIIEVMGTRLAIGRGVAAKIFVK